MPRAPTLQVAEMQPDPEHDASVVGLVPVGVGQGLLELDGGAQRIDSGDYLQHVRIR